jgi:hypothetical protein
MHSPIPLCSERDPEKGTDVKRAMLAALAGATVVTLFVATRWGLQVRRIHREWAGQSSSEEPPTF